MRWHCSKAFEILQRSRQLKILPKNEMKRKQASFYSDCSTSHLTEKYFKVWVLNVPKIQGKYYLMFPFKQHYIVARCSAWLPRFDVNILDHVLPSLCWGKSLHYCSNGICAPLSKLLTFKWSSFSPELSSRDAVKVTQCMECRALLWKIPGRICISLTALAILNSWGVPSIIWTHAYGHERGF